MVVYSRPPGGVMRGRAPLFPHLLIRVVVGEQTTKYPAHLSEKRGCVRIDLKRRIYFCKNVVGIEEGRAASESPH